MSAHLPVILGVLVVALAVIVYAWMPRRTHRHTPPRGYYDEDAQRWTTAPAVLGELSPADLDEIDALEHLLSLDAYDRAADHTTSEGD